MRFKRCILPITLIALLLICVRTAWAQHVRLTILTVNDVYEITPTRHWGGLAELMTLLQAERATAAHHLTTVNGDFLSPSFMSTLFQGAQTIELFNVIGVDVVTFGNHEFDFGPDVTRQRIAESHFPWLGSNVLGPDGQPFSGATATLTRQVGELAVGLLGLLTPASAELSNPGPDITFAPVVPTAKAAVSTLRHAGADVIIALTHLPMAADRVLARQVPGIDVILGGHDHQPMTRYEEGTLIHKSGYNARYLGRIDLDIEKHSTSAGSRVTVVPTWRMIANHRVTPEPTVAAKIKPFADKLDAEPGQPLGRSLGSLDSRRATVRTRESTMGNLIADALRETLRADVALINGGGIRGDRWYEAGTALTRRDIFTELPFRNVGVLVELSGADIVAALEHSVSGVERQAGGFPQLSGLRLVYDPSKPAGQRVIRVTLKGHVLQPTATYRLATNDYLLRGGDGYTALARGEIVVVPNSGALLSTIVMDHIASRGKIAYNVEGRILALAE